MKINIEKSINKDGDKQSISLVYYYGSHVDENGKTKHNRKRKTLGLYLYTTPTTELEKQHNEETLQLVEQIKAKQLNEYTKGQHGFIEIPVIFPETVKTNLIKVNLTIDLDQLIKELAKRGYQLVKAKS